MIRRIRRGVMHADAQRAAQLQEETRKVAEDRLREYLQSIAKAQRQIEDAAKVIDSNRADIERILKAQNLPGWTDGVLEASFVDVYTNEKKEIDPKKLYQYLVKLRKSDSFFSCIKVQVGETKKFLAENEVRELAVITKPKKTGTELKIVPVKPVAPLKTRGRK